MRVGVVVEEVADRDLAEGEGDAGDILFRGHLVGTVRDVLLLAAETEHVAKEQACRIVVREIVAGLLSFDVREPGDAVRLRETETLEGLRVVVELGPLVGVLEAEEAGDAERIAHLAELVQAVRPGVGGGERRIALADDGGLRVDAREVEDGLRENAAGQSGSDRVVVEPVVQPQLHRLESEIGTIVLAGDRQVSVDAGELVVVVLELGAEVLRQQHFDAAADHVAGPPEIDVVVHVAACKIGGVQPVAIIVEPAGAVDQQIARRVADTTAKGAVDLNVVVDDGWAEGTDVLLQIAAQVGGKREVGFRAQQKSEGRHVVVAGLETALTRTELVRQIEVFLGDNGRPACRRHTRGIGREGGASGEQGTDIGAGVEALPRALAA